MSETENNGILLSEILDVTGAFSPDHAAAVAIRLCGLVQSLHQRKPAPILYRDLRPDNILFFSDDHVELAQIGVAGFSGGQPSGQEKADRQAEIYAVGLVLYQMLTGVASPSSRCDAEKLEGIPELLRQCVAKATAPHPEQWYPSIGAMALALQEPAEPPPPPVVCHTEREKSVLFPKHCPYSRTVKLWLMPVHITLLFLGVFLVTTDILARSSLPSDVWAGNIIRDVIVIFGVVIPLYIWVLNLGNLGQTLPFLRGRKKGEKALMLVLLLSIMFTIWVLLHY